MLRIFSIFLATLTLKTLTAEQADSLVFSAMGCGPYTAEDVQAIAYYIREENRSKDSEFLVHLGDINSGDMARKGKLTEDYYASIRKLLTENNKIPTYIVPGDNEWNDRPDPEMGWKHWTRHLGNLENNFKVKWKTERQKIRPENFSFVRKGVLFIGINLVGGRIHDKEEWARRFNENNDWIEMQFMTHRQLVSAAVVCCQANPISKSKGKMDAKKPFTPFYNRFGKLGAKFAKPVLFLHADGHQWIVDQPWENAPNITRIQLDRVNASFPPAQFTIKPSTEKPFSFDRRLQKPEWNPQ